jgi:DNA-binding NarL/FixJ family response regulator
MSVTKVRVVIADDDERVRSDFRDLLMLESDFEIVGLASDGANAVEMCRSVHPDVAIMDIRMPGLDGIEATRLLRSSNPAHSRILIVTTFDLDDYLLGAARAGAGGFLLKDLAPEQLANAVRTVAAGDGIVSPRATARLLHEFTRPVTPQACSVAIQRLTDREVEIVALLARGLSNDEIAEQAFVSLGTVKTHISNVLLKLDLHSRIQIVVWAYEHGIAGTVNPPSRHGGPAE